MKKYILASRSPRRQELLKLVLPSFEVIPSGEEEDLSLEVASQELVLGLAKQKAKSVAEKHSDCVVIGCDTIVVSPRGEVFGIPKDEKQAREMLKSLSGKIHEVMTAVCFCFENQVHCFVQKTQVEFYTLNQQEIDEYIVTGEPFDKAGAYGIQGFGSVLVKGISGDYFNV
ncbi:MAG: septum formation protein Maf, partial [Oscillospiraceae bacterium]|nr:septum formation protein Maf [Oscillospiraceae bacterium]